MPKFVEAEALVAATVDRVAAATFPRLRDAGVTFCCLFALPKDGAPSLQHNGYGAAAVIKPTSQQDRAAGLADVLLVVDQHTWDSLANEEREALIDHELCHLELDLNQVGAVKQDDCGRPSIKTRKHDYQLGVFREVIARHGKKSLDAQVLEQAATECVQKTLWG
jgi:hypothetical protein